MKRPIAVTVIGWLFVAVGIIATTYHLIQTNWSDPFGNGNGWVLAVRVLAGVAGVLVLRGSNAGRWLLVVWMAYHVLLSYFHPLIELLVHTGLFVLLVYFLMFNRRCEDFFRI
jgi:hypothetical protein